MKSTTIYIPLALQYNERLREQLVRLLAAVGGVTVYPAVGGWVAPDGTVEKESVNVSEFITDRDISIEVQLVIEAMHAAGEKSVLVTEQEITARFVLPPTGDWEDRGGGADRDASMDFSDRSFRTAAADGNDPD
jgi:hypothetical protein